MEELAGTNGSLESRSLELSSHVNNLQLLLKDETLVSLLRRSFETKFETLKDMDLLLEDIKDHFVKMESETQQSYPVTEQDSYVSKFSAGLDNIAIVEMENVEGNGEGGDSFESNFRKTVEGFHFRNKILADKVKGFSTSMDEFIAALLTKLRATRDEVVVKIEQMRSLKQEVNNLEMDRQAQENKIAMLENDITILGSVCTDATHELKIEVENNPVELSSVPELKKLNYLLSEAREFSLDAVADRQLGLDGSKYIKTAENLLLAAGNARALIGQFENVRNVLVTAIEDLENKCTETRRNLENAIEERDLKQNKISKLESDLRSLQNSYQEMRFKLEDYQAKEDKLKDREAEISSLSATAIKDLENKLTETRITLENAIGERDFNQNKISKLESDLRSLQNSYQEMRFKLEDYQAKEDKLKDREAEISSLSATAIKDLENKLTETRITLENAIGERDFNQNKISKLESDLRSLQNSYQEMRFKLEDYQAKEDKLKDREAEISSLSATAIKDLENKLTETRITLENAIGERDFNQNKISKLESDLRSLQNSYQEMRFKLEDYQAKEDKLKDREAEISSLSATAIKDLENKLTETRITLENAIGERDFNQNKISKLESDLRSLQNSYQEMRFKLEDYQAKEDKLKDREAEISSLSATAIKDLENKLTETRITLENAIGERDFNQNKISKLESDLRSLQNSYQEMRFKLEDYQAKEDKLKDREAEISSLSATAIKDLENKLTETRITLENAIGERDFNQNKISKLESDLRSLQNSYQEMRFKLEDYQAKEDKLKDREAEISSLSATAIKDLENKLTETRITLENAIGERDFNQNKISKLESDLRSLQERERERERETVRN
ncbi:myosin-J heavy chain-like [Camellia sinensis]|uniref:myosin-J heavy chain-like n=1 Tax=Camellia sinensis TaxID=4442 RepID=UPI001036C51C|nr:myosin-J heavy chain-like [Camellia sinensis]